MNKKKIVKFAVFIILSIGLMGCTTVKIADLEAKPAFYAGKTVELKGMVNNVVKIPFTEACIYKLEDGSGNIIVFSPGIREDESSIKVEALVVAYDNQETLESSDQAVNSLKDYLVSKNILGEAAAETVAKAALRIISGLSESIEGVWFLIEQEEE